MINHYIAVGLGGALGSISRIALSSILPASIWGIPCPILFINILGCFLMGLLIEFTSLHYSISDNARYFLVSGFLGGFTTFSAFALEFGLLYEKNQFWSAVIYTLLSVGISLSAFFGGIKLVKILL